MVTTIIGCTLIIVGAVLYAHHKHLSVSTAIKTKLERLESKIDGGAIPSGGSSGTPTVEQK